MGIDIGPYFVFKTEVKTKGYSMASFTHIDKEGHVRMVDVTEKKTYRPCCDSQRDDFDESGNL